MKKVDPEYSLLVLLMAVSALVVAGLVWYFKRKKWF